MTAVYLIRFDDICPTMKWDMWERIELILDKHRIRPLLAVVPENRDPVLQKDNPKKDFWDRARRWRDKNWSIGLHGYQHIYVTNEKGFYGRIAQSEFSGLPLHEQETKLRLAVEILRGEDISPAAWVAPSHSFDHITLAGLDRIGLKVISDGFFLGPRIDKEGFTWIPQQLGRVKAMPFGFWTMAFHHNNWTIDDLSCFDGFLSKHRHQVVGLDTVMNATWPRLNSLEDKFFSTAFNCVRRMRAMRGRQT